MSGGKRSMVAGAHGSGASQASYSGRKGEYDNILKYKQKRQL